MLRPLRAASSVSAASSEGSFAAVVQINFKKRLQLPPTQLDLDVSLQPGAETRAQYSVALRGGLTLQRVLERTLPKARVGVTSATESRVY